MHIGADVLLVEGFQQGCLQEDYESVPEMGVYRGPGRVLQWC